MWGPGASSGNSALRRPNVPLNAQCAGGWGDVLYGWAESRKMALWMSRELGKIADYYEQKQGALAEHLARTARILKERSDSKLQFLYCEAGKAIKICISLSKRYLRGGPESAGTASLLAELRAGDFLGERDARGGVTTRTATRRCMTWPRAI